ncbi:uncharacterized protein [Littorina saxatilis]
MSCGLWYYCEDVVGETQCDPYTWTEYDLVSYYVSFYAVHLSVGLATLLSIVIVVLFVAKLLGDDNSATSVGVCGVIAGVLGIIAAAVFFGLPVKSLNLYYGNFQAQSFVFNYNKRFADYETAWAAIVYLVGSGLMLFSSVALFFIPSSDIPSSNRVDMRHY